MDKKALMVLLFGHERGATVNAIWKQHVLFFQVKEEQCKKVINPQDACGQ